MKIAIIGIGDIGLKLAQNLGRRAGNEIILIDSDEERCEQLASELDALIIHGDGTNPETFKKARLADADALVATTDSDALNTVVAMLAHRLGVPKIIVKLNDVSLMAACQEIGVSKIVTPKVSTAAEILSSLAGFDRLDFSLVAQGGLHLMGIGVGNAQGKHMADLDLPDGILVVAILRGEQVLVPRGRTKIEPDDTFFVLLENEKMEDKLRQILGI